MVLIGNTDGLVQQLQIRNHNLDFYNQIEALHIDKVSSVLYTGPINSQDGNKVHKMIISVGHDGVFHFSKKESQKVSGMSIKDQEYNSQLEPFTHEDADVDTLHS